MVEAKEPAGLNVNPCLTASVGCHQTAKCFCFGNVCAAPGIRHARVDFRVDVSGHQRHSSMAFRGLALGLCRLNLLGFVCVSLLASACSKSERSASQPASGANGGASGGGASRAGSGGAVSSGSGGIDLSVGGNEPACESRCSIDLHQVLDCNDAVLQTCGAAEGCSAGSCVPACASAEANRSNVGCEYYTVNPTSWDTLDDKVSCFAAFIVNTWQTPITIEVERGGVSLDVSKIARIPSGSGAAITYAPLPGGELPPNEVAILFLAQGIDPTATSLCPAGIDVGVEAANTQMQDAGYGEAFHIQTSAPVSAYDMYPYGGGASAITSATLLLPTAAWDTNYIAVGAQVAEQKFGAEMYVVGTQDGTEVTINPVTDIEAGTGVAAAAKGVPVTYALDEGQILHLSQQLELTGSAIQSSKPVGVWGGSRCLYVPSGTPPCDTTHQQIPPVRALGHEYLAARYRNRYAEYEEAPPWRLVGAVDGTTLTYDPAPPTGAPTTLSAGELIEFRASGPFSIRSQDAAHPFYMAAFMTSCHADCIASGAAECGDCRGDPEVVNVVPTAQYLDRYVFFTDPTYPETNLVLTRTKGKDGFRDVELDCLGTVAGWEPIGKDGKYELARVDLVSGNFEKQGSCDNGRHEIASDGMFAVTVWGWGSEITGGYDPTLHAGRPGFYTQAVSYAYPAGASLKLVNDVVVPPVVK
jgi:hypothetical protein